MKEPRQLGAWAKPSPSQERLRAAMDYDGETGIFRWKWRADRSVQWNGRYFRKRAGSQKPDGRWIIVFGNDCGRKQLFRASRLAWIYIYGVEPIGEIDHRDGNPENDAIENLREADRSEQNQNKRGWSKRGLPKGITITRSGRFGAQLSLSGKRYWGGSHRTIDEAREAYAEMAERVFGEFARPE